MSEVSFHQDILHNSQTHSSLLRGRPTLSNHLLTGDRGYYRSKIFNTQLGINPLVAAASPLLALACQIADSQPPEDLYSFYQHLQHEIKAFENNAQTQRFRSETILIARYLLCATIDELIISAPWRNNSDWQNHRLLMFFHQEHEGSERFFSILERLTADPAIHIDLLELIYLCLSAGFLGKYRHITQGKETLDQIASRLFEIIRWERGDLKKELNVLPSTNEKPPVAKMHLPLWLIISFTFALLLTIYSSYSYMLGNSAQLLYQQLSSLVSQIDNGNS